MRRPLKITLLVLGILLGLFVLAFAGLLFKYKLESKEMAALETGEIKSGLYVLKDGFSNVYIVRDGSSLLVFDAGNSPKVLRKEFARLNLDPDSVKAVFLTHSDKDHTGGIALFKNARIYFPFNEIPMINGEKNRLLIFKNKLKISFESLKDQQRIKFGRTEVFCIETPGHTPGSMSYVIQGKYLVTGDNLKLIQGKAFTFNEFFNMDSARQRQSFKKIMHLQGIELVLTSHYGMTENYPKLFEDYR